MRRARLAVGFRFVGPAALPAEPSSADYDALGFWHVGLNALAGGTAPP